MANIFVGDGPVAGGFGRRRMLQGLAALAGTAASPLAMQRAFAAERGFGPPQPFDFERLAESARRTAAMPYTAPVGPSGALLDRIDYDAYWRIRFQPDAALNPIPRGAETQLFPLGRYFRRPVRIFLHQDGMAREATYDPSYFEMPAESPARSLPPNAGFAGFRVMRPGGKPDWISFVGASYFRTDGPFGQYGLSARGLAIDAGLGRPEEFPDFVAFWLGPPENPSDDLTVYALLDSPSVTGAYRFGLRRGGMEEGHRISVAAQLFFRSGVERLGVAPLTSMYWYSERQRAGVEDWRPEVHDSDGLALDTGAGERIWRPLRNPGHVTTSSFTDDGPAGFGLIQRDRSFENYQDDGAFYDRRPSAWITPDGDWGKGAVQLLELPTGDETMDNIVAYWTPERQPAAGDRLSFAYVIDWARRDPPAGAVAEVAATYQGVGGAPGQPTKSGVGKMIVDFAGAAIAGLGADSGIEPVIDIRNGALLAPIAARPVVGARRWRLSFDFTQDGPEPVDLRAYLRKDGVALTETWMALVEV